MTNANGAVNSITENTCDGAGPLPHGTVNGTATVDVHVPHGRHRDRSRRRRRLCSVEKPFHVETDGTGSNSGNAVKRFVDAKISIGPDDYEQHR